MFFFQFFFQYLKTRNKFQFFFSNFFYKSVQIYIKDAECAWRNEKSVFRFLFSELWSFLYSSRPKISMNFHDNSKNKNRKIDFLFDSEHCASFIKTGAKLTREGRSANPYLGKSLITIYPRQIICINILFGKTAITSENRSSMGWHCSQCSIVKALSRWEGSRKTWIFNSGWCVVGTEKTLVTIFMIYSNSWHQELEKFNGASVLKSKSVSYSKLIFLVGTRTVYAVHCKQSKTNAYIKPLYLMHTHFSQIL